MLFFIVITTNLDLLRKKLSQIEVKGTINYSYYDCGQDHYRRNPNWKPWQHLEWYCDKTRYDFLEARDMILVVSHLPYSRYHQWMNKLMVYFYVW
jgi:hypothetical protein